MQYLRKHDDDVVTLRIRSGDRYDYFDLPRRH